MIPEFIEDRLAKQPWVKPAEETLSAISEGTIDKLGTAIRNFLHGTWLGHPLHPVITDVPVGAFTVAAALDVADAARGTEDYTRGADAAVAIGLASSTLAAASGLADWSKTHGDGRRVGVLHAALNGGATLCYLASYLLRKNGQRSAGVGAGLLGYALLGAGAYLGGNLVYNHKIGVDHAERTGPDGFTPIFPESELPENEPHRVEIEGTGVLIVKQNGQIFAIGEKCSHLGGPLAEGKLGQGTITCPWHGSKFRLADGTVEEGPAAYPQACFQARVREGQVEVRLLKRN